MATLKPLQNGGYYVDGRKKNGERVQKTFTPKRYGTKARQKATELFEALIIENSDLVESTLVKGAEKKLTVSDLADKYNSDHLQYTKATNNKSYLKIICDKWGRYRAVSIPMINVRVWLNGMLDDGTYSPYSVRMIARYFIRIFNFGKESRIVSGNPLDNLIDMNLKRRFKALCKDRKVSVQFPDFSKMISGFPAQLKRTCLLAWYTGMRAGEIVYLKWSQIHGDIVEKLAEDTKENERKIIILEREAMDILAEIQAEQLSDNVETDRVFPGLTVVNNGKSFEHWRNKAGYNHVRFHDIRHMYKKRKRSEGHHERIIEAQMGHKINRTMGDIYDNVDIEDLRKLAEEK